MKEKSSIGLAQTLQIRLGDRPFVAAPTRPDPSRQILDRILEKDNQIGAGYPIVKRLGQPLVEREFRFRDTDQNWTLLRNLVQKNITISKI